MLAVGRDLDVFGILRPPARTRSRLALRLEEREEMSSVLRRSVESSVDEQSSDQYHPTAASSRILPVRSSRSEVPLLTSTT